MGATVRTLDFINKILGSHVKLPDTSSALQKLPEIHRSSKIVYMKTKSNPIHIRLEDGTDVFLTYDEFKRISGNPAKGKTMEIVFQRSQEDKSNNFSKINSIKII